MQERRDLCGRWLGPACGLLQAGWERDVREDGASLHGPRQVLEAADLQATWQPLQATWQPLQATWQPLQATWQPLQATWQPLQATWQPLQIPLTSCNIKMFNCPACSHRCGRLFSSFSTPHINQHCPVLKVCYQVSHNIPGRLNRILCFTHFYIYFISKWWNCMFYSSFDIHFLP